MAAVGLAPAVRAHDVAARAPRLPADARVQALAGVVVLHERDEVAVRVRPDQPKPRVELVALHVDRDRPALARLEGAAKLTDDFRVGRPEMRLRIDREAAKRVLGQRHYDVQLIGGMVLHSGAIAQMRTGEGKTLVATAPVYLNALEGKGVHVITVNDYLANRDADWMGQVYRFLGLSVGKIVHGMDDNQRRAAYACDVTYGTNNEFGFDYLRDNMKHERGQMVQRPFNFAIVDEVDSILIDEARTPLIISGPTEDKSDLYVALDEVAKLIPEEWYEKDEKTKNIQLNEEGHDEVEKILIEKGLLETDNLYDIENTQVVHHLDQALRAVHMFRRGVHYFGKDD